MTYSQRKLEEIEDRLEDIENDIEEFEFALYEEEIADNQIAGMKNTIKKLRLEQDALVSEFNRIKQL